jgi:hypothetical protein
MEKNTLDQIQEDFIEEQRLDNMDREESEIETDIEDEEKVLKANRYKVEVGKILQGVKL